MRYRSGLVCLAILALLVGVAGRALADDSSSNQRQGAYQWSQLSVTTQSGPEGVQIDARYQAWLAGSQGVNSPVDGGSQNQSAGVVSNVTFAAVDLGTWTQAAALENPGMVPVGMYVAGQLQRIYWVPASNTTAAATSSTGADPHSIALDILDHVPLPDIQVRMNPGLGLVALPSWFWVEGYNGQPFGNSRTVTIPPLVGSNVPTTTVPLTDSRRLPSSITVAVRLWPSQYEWSFGDNASLVTQSLGQPYPAESDIQHTYQHSSLQYPNGFPVQLVVTFQAEYQVNGWAPQALPPITHIYESDYPVQEVQTVLTSP